MSCYAQAVRHLGAADAAEEAAGLFDVIKIKVEIYDPRHWEGGRKRKEGRTRTE
jgi:hypothetical protein